MAQRYTLTDLAIDLEAQTKGQIVKSDHSRCLKGPISTPATAISGVPKVTYLPTPTQAWPPTCHRTRTMSSSDFHFVDVELLFKELFEPVQEGLISPR